MSQANLFTIQVCRGVPGISGIRFSLQGRNYDTIVHSGHCHTKISSCHPHSHSEDHVRFSLHSAHQKLSPPQPI